MGLNQGLALVGFMGAGKSTVGRALAHRLCLPFVDTDDRLASRFGAIVDQIRDGEASFRHREAEIVAELCDGVPRVLATGGGAFLHPESRERLAANYITVYLEASLEVLATRVQGSGRPLWDEEVSSRFLARQPLYETADHTVPTGGRTVEQVVDDVLRSVGA